MAALIWLICTVATCTLRIVSSQVSGQLTPETTVLEASSVAVSPTPTYMFEGYAFVLHLTKSLVYMYMHYTVFSMTLYHVLFLHICSLTSGVGPTPSMQPSGGTPAVVVPDTAESTLTIIAANLSDMFAGKWL